MRALLMYGDQDFDDQLTPPWNKQALIEDLELNTLFAAMASEDRFVFEVVSKAVLVGTQDSETILYRQEILKDCLENEKLARNLYALVVGAIENEKKVYLSIFSRYPGSILRDAIKGLTVLVGTLRELRSFADTYAGRFHSKGFTGLFDRIKKELTDDYLRMVHDHLNQLKFPDGILLSAGLGKGNKGIDHTLHKIRKPKGWFRRLFPKKEYCYTFRLADRDESGARALSQIRDQGINLVADTLARSVDHIRGFFILLRTELAFYIGCMNLHEQLAQSGYPTCFPVPTVAHQRAHSFVDLFDPCLAITTKEHVVANNLDLDHKGLAIITGANQGGKSTFLRSIGLAQLMMQCGMFVAGTSFRANRCAQLVTHFRREEDSGMESGKLDEELRRMSEIVDHAEINTLILFNESFAATNEREGSEIARQVVSALVEERIKIFFVTHLYDFASGFVEQKRNDVVSLRAERSSDGTRSFQMLEADPKPTSYGKDLYEQIFGKAVTGGARDERSHHFHQ